MKNRKNAMKINYKTGYKRKPKLRFSEFHDDWEYKKLQQFLEEHVERVSANTGLPIYSSTREGLKEQKDYFDGHELLNNGEYGIVPKGYFVYRHMSDDDVFVFNINDTGSVVVVSKEYPVFRTISLNSIFLLHLLNYNSDFKKFAAMQKKGGTRTRLYFSVLCEWETFLPNLKEQQKIASCLSSINELISKQTQKINTLKKHKNGLMQQLFLESRSSLPRLRFPEFQCRPNWQIKSLRELINSSPEYGINAPAIPYAEELPTYIRITDISDEGCFEQKNKASVVAEHIDNFYLNSGDIVVARTGASVGKSYRYQKKDGRLVFAGFLMRIKPDSHKIRSSYLSQYLNTRQYWSWIHVTSGRSGQPGINSEEYAALPVPIPSPSGDREKSHLSEQGKIADCLSVLDNLIVAHRKKLIELTKFKKGLIQQIFPKIEEVEA